MTSVPEALFTVGETLALVPSIYQRINKRKKDYLFKVRKLTESVKLHIIDFM